MANKKTDIYDVSKYTDIELYNILDLNQPTDRELEAKIHFFINKYENTQSIDDRKLYKFFNDIYIHLFDLPQDDEQFDDQDQQNDIDELQEGFEIASSGLDVSNQIMFEPSGSAILDQKLPENTKVGTTPDQSNQLAKVETKTVKPIDYIPGNLNPLLKQTIKRIISVDSQYRDRTTYPLTTFFTFNLSDTLSDVVSLKLYSVQIPYTWYTIDGDFGSNFFYLKGITPGIDDGNSDYKFEIDPGNYTAPDLITQLNKSILDVNGSNNVIDLSNTSVVYTPGNAKCTFNINIVQRYNDINYELYFPTWTNPGDNNESISGNTNTSSRFNSIPGFLGYLNTSSIPNLPNSTYSTYNMYSHPTTIPISTTAYIKIDDYNNYFDIIFYTDTIGSNPYPGSSPSSSKQLPPIKVRMINSSLTTSDKTPLNNGYTITSIMQFINTGFAAIPQLVGSTINTSPYNITNIDPSGNPTISSYNRICINIKLNKQTNSFYDGMKAVIQFPSDNRLWLSPTSLFQFDSSINELNNIISEIDTPTTSFIIENNPYIYMKCNTPYYGNNGIQTYTIDQIIPDICGNPTNISGLPFHNTYTSLNTYNINPNNQNDYYISQGNYTVYGDELTIKNKTINITSGNIDISGNNYTVYGQNYAVSGNALINGNLNILPTNSVTKIINDISTNSYNITGQDYTISKNTPIPVTGNIRILQGNVRLQGNASLQGNTNLTVSGQQYSIIGNTTPILSEINIINGNSKILGNTSPIIISGNGYYISGNSFITQTTYSGNVIIIGGNAIIGAINPHKIKIYGNSSIIQNNYSISGNTKVYGSIKLNGNVNITGLTDNNAVIQDVSAYIIIPYSSSGVYDLSNSTYNIITNTAYFIQGRDTINGQPNSIYINGTTTIESGNAIINSPTNSYNIISGLNYFMDSSIDGNINIKGKTNITKANIQIYSDSSYNINGTRYSLIGNTYSVTGSTTVVTSSNPVTINSDSSYNIIGQNIIGQNIIDQAYTIVDGSTNITGPITITTGNVNITNASAQCTISGNNYSVQGTAYISDTLRLNSGNLNVSSTNPYIIKGNSYNVTYNTQQCSIQGNSYIVNGNSYIYGHNYSVYGNIKVYQDNRFNDFRIDISNNIAGYLLSEYLTAINASMQTAITTNLQIGSSITIDTNNSLLHSSIKFNFNKSVTPNYTINLSQCYLYNVMNLHSQIDISSNTTVKTSQFPLQGGGYKIDDSNSTIIITSTGQSNLYVPPITLNLTHGNYSTINNLCNSINTFFANYSKYGISMKGSTMQYTTSTAGILSITFTIIIVNLLDETNYTAYFYDDNLIAQRDISDSNVPGFYGYISNWSDLSTNTWYTNLKIPHQTYDLSNASITGLNSYSEILGTDTIQSNSITLTASTNYFWLKPVYDPNGGVYTETPSSTPNNGLFNDILITVLPGTYSKELLQSQINSIFSANPITAGSSITFIPKNNLQYTSIRLNIRKNYTTKDFVLNFYDQVSFTKCNVGLSGKSSIQNVLWDTTLGWILGFRNTTLYYLTPENRIYNPGSTTIPYYYNQYPYTKYTYDDANNATITGDTCVSVFLYNYFMIILDDYVQNHLNDGLVTITNTDTSIPLPSYANRATYRCDPITKKPMVISTPTNNQNLTAKQLYAANEILNVQQTEQSKYSSGPFIQDIFGLVPIKTSGMQNGQPYIEFGGSLQLQERTYFGPVNIRRMTIKLINDKGNVVNLNGANWSFSLICEQLYTSQN